MESLCPLLESGTIDPQVDPRSVDSSVVRKMLIYINQWTKNLNNDKFLNTHPVEKDSILSSYGIISKVFSNIGIYSKAPPPACPSPKDADSPSPPQPRPHPTAPAAAPVTLAAGATAGRSTRKKKKAVEHPGTPSNMIRARTNLPSLLPTCSA